MMVLACSDVHKKTGAPSGRAFFFSQNFSQCLSGCAVLTVVYQIVDHRRIGQGRCVAEA